MRAAIFVLVSESEEFLSLRYYFVQSSFYIREVEIRNAYGYVCNSFCGLSVEIFITLFVVP